MTGKILRSILTVAAAVLAASLVIITGVLYGYFAGLQESLLRDALHLAAGATEQLGVDYLEGLGSDRYRLTWVGADGTVLFESHADAASMENHAEREEIRQAHTQGSGSSVRYSATLTQQTIYEAQRLGDGSVLRISVSRASALRLALGMLQPGVIMLLLAIGLSAWLAQRMAKRITEPLNRLDLDDPLKNEAYEELSPLLRRIHAQQQEIRAQLRTLRQKQEEFDQITGSMKEALVLLDRDGRILSINPAARALFGAPVSCVGQPLLSVDGGQALRRALEEAGQRGRASLRDTRGGREYQFDLSGIASEGSVRGTVLLAYDITEQVNAEKHRREFTANVSHELKTPLQSIIGSAELMENGIVKAEDAPRFLGRIRTEAARLVDLIDDIIRLSQLDEGADMARESVALPALVQEVCRTLQDAAHSRGVTVEVRGGAGTVVGVRRLLYEVVYNLCDNAVKYNRPGGSVTVEVEPRPGEVVLRVADTGIGIPREHREKVFERFYRVDKSHSRASGGTGLGLSIVKHAVQLHQGRLTLESEPGRGTVITVHFPAP